MNKGRDNEVKIDRKRRVILVNKTPFFPIGIIPEMALKKRDFLKIKKAGFNTIWDWYPDYDVSIKQGKKFLKLAETYGLKVCETLTRYSPEPVRYASPTFCSNYQKVIGKMLPEVIKNLKDFPSLLSWISLDEPNLASSYTKDKGDALKVCQKIYDLAKRLDPAHPMWVCFCVNIPETKEWTNVYDIAGVDTYWDPLRREQTPLYVASCAQDAYHVTEKYRKPFTIVLQTDIWSGSYRSLTPEEQRCQTYLALISGAKGIIYFFYPVFYKPMWEELTKLVGEINYLAPALLTLTHKQRVVVKEGKIPIAVLLKRYEKKTYLITVNFSQRNVEVNFQLTGLTSSSEIKVLFEERRITPSKENFVDTYSGYQTHVYEIAKMNFNSKTPVLIKMEVTAKPIKETEFHHFIELKNNLLKNPGFEKGMLGWQFSDWSKKSEPHAIGEIDEKIFHQGKKSLHIYRSHKCDRMSAVHFLSEPITLEPNTYYRFGGFMKSNIEIGVEGPRIMIVALSKGLSGIRQNAVIETQGRNFANPSGKSDWREYSASFFTGDDYLKVQFSCSFCLSIGHAWFDDLYLVKEAKGKKRINLIKNSSFEDATNPGWPDYWRGFDVSDWSEYPFNGSLAWDKMIGEKNSNWTVDSSISYHGTKSLKVSALSNDLKKFRICTSQMGVIPVEGGKIYTFSLYIRADRENVPVRLFILDPSWQYPLFQDVRLTTSWKRYIFTAKIHPGQRNVVIRFDLMGKGTIWVDAVQFEKENKATSYRP